MKKIGVVVTTIFDGKFLHKYVSAVATAQEHHEVAFYVVGDQNTSPVCRKSSEEVASTFPCAYTDIAEQEKLLLSVGFPPHMIPYRSDNRRNVGFLRAYADGCDIVVSIDETELLAVAISVDFVPGRFRPAGSGQAVEVVAIDRIRRDGFGRVVAVGIRGGRRRSRPCAVAVVVEVTELLPVAVLVDLVARQLRRRRVDGEVRIVAVVRCSASGLAHVRAVEVQRDDRARRPRS